MHVFKKSSLAAAFGVIFLAGTSFAAEYQITDPQLLAELELQPTPGYELTLGQAIAEAEARNLAIHAAKLEIDRADARLAQAWGLVMPMLSAGLNAIHADKADVVDFGESMAAGLGPILESVGIELPPMEPNPTVVRRQDTVTGQITAALSVINVKNWFTISAARKGLDVTRLSIESVRQQLLVGVAQAYYMALMSKNLVDMQITQVKSAAHHLDFATKRYESGAGLKIEVARAQTDLADARQQLLSARLAFDSARDALGVLTGNAGLPMPVATDELPMPAGSDDELVSWAHKHRLDLAVGEASILLAKRQYNVAWAGFLPTFDMAWQGSYQFTEPSALGAQDRARWNLVFNLNIPIFQYFTIGALKEAKVSTRIAQLKLEDQKQNIGAEVRQARRDHQTALASAELAGQQVLLAREVMELAQTAYEAGAGSSLEVTDARRTVAAAEVNLMARQLQVQISRLVLHRALGTEIKELIPN